LSNINPLIVMKIGSNIELFYLTGGMGGMGGGSSNGGGGGGGGMGRKGGMASRDRGMDGYDSQTGHCVHMRGLPFAATEQDILEVSIYSIHIKYLKKEYTAENVIFLCCQIM
jgi:hypothetical protein